MGNVLLFPLRFDRCPTHCDSNESSSD